VANEAAKNQSGWISTRPLFVPAVDLVEFDRPTEHAPRNTGREASPLERPLGFYCPLDSGFPLGPAIIFRRAYIEGIESFQYPPTPLCVHRRAPSCLLHYTLRGLLVRNWFSMALR
jgi:hypothetical protein